MIDYKKIFRSRAVRLRILSLLDFIPDKQMIELQYWIKTGRKLNWKAPKRFSEKLQVYKINYKNPDMVRCVDKYDVREYIEECGLGEILNECYGVFDSPEETDFSVFPKSFVLKNTLGGGGNSVIIVEDKGKMDKAYVMSRLNDWVSNTHTSSGGREWPYYSGKKPRIIAEKYIESNEESGGLIDYKFFCFNGEAKYLYVICDRALGKDGAFGIFDVNFNKLNYTRVGERPLTREIKKPDNFDEMISIAEKISSKFPHARVDLYNNEGQIIFGEVTFFSGSGYIQFDPDEFDFILGDCFKLS